MPCRLSLFKDEFKGGFLQIRTDPADKHAMTAVENIMTREAICIDMDTALGEAMELCLQNRVRHLPVVDELKHLAGLVTDRDLRAAISPRLGTLSENNRDRETLGFRVHRIMARHVVSTSADATLAEAAQLMLTNRIGCLPVVDGERCVIGIITTSDLLRYLAENN
jgi:CBS domain-containing protein